MPAMSTGASTGLVTSEAEKAGLPKISYAPPIITTMLAALLLFLTMLGLGFFGVLNTLSQFDKASRHEEGGSTVTGTVCGVLTVLAIVGMLYFFLAIIKGFRDLSEPPCFTRGTAADKPGIQGRSARNWLLVNPSYVGTDLAAAAEVTDEQRAASVDRSQILNPRFSPSRFRRRRETEDDLRGRVDRSDKTSSGYLNPSRISANRPVLDLESETLPQPPAVFRIDFANKLGLTTGEEVIVAHSHHLEHIYYIARLRNGQWEAFRNRSLI